MARMEGNNQPDLLNILRKRAVSGPVPQVPAPPSSAPTPRSMPVLSPEMPSRGSRRSGRDVWILGGLGIVVAGLAAAVIWSRSSRTPVAPASTSVVPPAARAPSAPAVRKPLPAPSAPGGIPLVTRAAPGKGRAFSTLVLATYGGSKEAEARATCAWLKSKGREYADVFLYRTSSASTGSQQLMICLNHYAGNPLKDQRNLDLQSALRRLPNAAGRREFEECYFSSLETSEP